jgi:glutamate racemase
MQRKVIILFLLILFFLWGKGQPSSSPLDEKLDLFFQKEIVTIAVTDSGLGGLSIMADASDRIKKWKTFAGVCLVFFNALFSTEGGYNSLRTREEKIQVFDSALRNLEKRYHPDLILIGCNTLSTLYPDTSFSKRTSIPVVGILEAGIELIAKSLRNFPESRVILFGTQTTISEATHKKKLGEAGFGPQKVILQACPELVDFIERGFKSDETEMLISAYVEEALQKLANQQTPIHVSLNCTHYGYSLALWKKAFSEAEVKPLSFINPNTEMIRFLFQPRLKNRFKDTTISARVVSMVKISRERLASIGSWLERISPLTANALKDYEWVPELFEWKKYVKRYWRE